MSSVMLRCADGVEVSNRLSDCRAFILILNTRSFSFRSTKYTVNFEHENVKNTMGLRLR